MSSVYLKRTIGQSLKPPVDSFREAVEARAKYKSFSPACHRCGQHQPRKGGIRAAIAREGGFTRQSFTCARCVSELGGAFSALARHAVAAALPQSPVPIRRRNIRRSYGGKEKVAA